MASTELSRWGLRRAAAGAGLARLEKWTGARVFVVQHCDNLPFPDERRLPVPADVSVRCLDYVADRLLMTRPEYGFRPELIDFMHANGHEVWALFAAERLVHYAVRGANVAPAQDGLVVRLGPEHVYYYKSFTLPDCRGRGYSHLRSQLTRDQLQGRHGQRSIFYVSPYNYASLRASAKESATNIGYAGYWRVGGRARFFAAAAVRDVGFAFDEPQASAERAAVLAT